MSSQSLSRPLRGRTNKQIKAHVTCIHQHFRQHLATHTHVHVNLYTYIHTCIHTYIHTYTRLSNRGSLDARVTHTHTHTPKLMVLRLRVVTSGVCSFSCGRCSPSCTPCSAGSSVTSSWVGRAISCVVASASGAERARLAWSGASGASGAWRSFCARCEWSRKNLGGLFLQRNLSLLNAHERLINPRAKTCDTSTITHFGDTAAVAELS